MPFSQPIHQAIWVVMAYNLYYSVAFTMWNMSKELSSALSTRNMNQRKNNSLAAEITRNVGTGLVSILFPMILHAVCAAVHGNNAQGYFLTMAIMACISLPLTFVQYFYVSVSPRSAATNPASPRRTRRSSRFIGRWECGSSSRPASPASTGSF